MMFWMFLFITIPLCFGSAVAGFLWGRGLGCR